jgi:hypothetical protein
LSDGQTLRHEANLPLSLSALVTETLHLKLKFLHNPNHSLWEFFGDMRKKQADGNWNLEFGLLVGLMNKRRCFNGASIYLSIPPPPS